VVKSFDWRISPSSERKDATFQIISLSQDQTVRIWPIDPLLIEDCGNANFESAAAEEISQIIDKKSATPPVFDSSFKKEYSTLAERLPQSITISSVCIFVVQLFYSQPNF
jgi:hypothetical protein